MTRMIPTKEEKEKVRRSLSGVRAAGVKKKDPSAEDRGTKPKFHVPDNLVPLPEEQMVKLTQSLKTARSAGNKLRSGYGSITKDLQGLWEACLVRVGGDPRALQHASLSDAMLMIYRDAETIDETFGPGTYKETRTASNGGASTWRKPWSRIKAKECGDTKMQKTPLEKLASAMITAVNTSEVPYAKALAALNRAYGKG